MLPTAPIPVQTAYAVPKGNERNAIAISPKLSAIATRVAAVGQNLVSPSECFRPKAQAISSKPAAKRAAHALMAFLSAREWSARRTVRSPGTAVRKSDRRQKPEPALIAPARDRRAA
jgi:hypothetical protein